MKQRWFFLLGTLWLLVVLAACGQGSTTNTAYTVQVTETEYHIASSRTSFLPGTTYHFVVTNKGLIAHEFMILPKSEGRMSETHMQDIHAMALAMIDHLNPGETKILDYTFASSAANSHPELVCYFPGHYEAGMKQHVIVS